MLESFDTRWQQQRAPSRASRRQIWNIKDRVCTIETKWSKIESGTFDHRWRQRAFMVRWLMDLELHK